MSIMPPIRKCSECDKEDQCALTLIMREYCKKPYKNKQEHIQAHKAGMYTARQPQHLRPAPAPE